MIDVQALCKTYPTRGEGDVHALRGVDFHCPAGEILGLLGPNGAGKTTTLRILSTLLPPTSGTVTIAGADLVREPETIRRRIAFLTTSTELYRRLTVREMLQFFGQLHDLPQNHLRKRLEVVTELLELGPFLDRRGDRLSTGMKQRASLARVIIHDPPVLILDEPTNGLDLVSTATVIDFLRACRAEGKTILFSSHHLAEVEKVCDRIALMNEGRIQLVAPLKELRTSQPDLETYILELLKKPTPAEQESPAP